MLPALSVVNQNEVKEGSFQHFTRLSLAGVGLGLVFFRVEGPSACWESIVKSATLLHGTENFETSKKSVLIACFLGNFILEI